MAKRNFRSDFEVLAKFRSGEWAVQPTLGEIYIPAERRMMKTQMNENGYLTIPIPPKSSHYPLSRAVWIGSTMNVPEFDDLEVDHINEVKTDNRFENLRLLTHAGNIRRSTSPLTYEQAEEIRERYAAGGITLKTLGKQYGCSKTAIFNIVKQQAYTHPKPPYKTKTPYENISRKTKEDIFHTFCVMGRKLGHILKQYNITKDTLWCIIEEQSLRTNSAKHEMAKEHEHEREHGENPANTAEPHHRTNKGELNHD